MRGALIHGVLLAVMLVYGYRTWTRDKASDTNTGSVVLWDKTENDLVSIEYKAPKKIVKIEKKPEGYWWGSDTTIEMKPKPKPPGEGSGSAGSAAGSAAGAGSGSAGSGAGSGSAAKPTPPPIEEEEVGRKTKEFPLGDNGDKLIKDLTAARALRDLGVPNDEQKKDFKLVDAKTTITLTFKDGPKTFLIGGSVYGGSDRYAVDQASGKAYVLAKDLVANLEIGETMLHLTDPRGFDAAKIDSVAIEAGGKSKTVIRIETEQDGTKRKSWADSETKTPNTLAANFVDGINNLRPTDYETKAKASDMQTVLKLTYKNDRGAVLGTLTMLRYERPGILQEGQELDPANPPKGETEYYVLTEKTRVPGLIRKDQAQRTENDIENVLAGKTEPSGSGAGSGKAVDPHGNPFGGPPPGHGALPPLGSAASTPTAPSPSPTPPTPMSPANGTNPAPGMPAGGAPAKAPAMGSAAAPAPKPVPTPMNDGPSRAPAAPAGSAAAH